MRKRRWTTGWVWCTATVVWCVVTAVIAGASDERQLGPCTRRTPLSISELMYHPATRADGRNVEFIEVLNTDPVFFELGGYRLTGDVEYTFPSNTILQGRQSLVVAADPAAITDVYGVTNVIGPYTGALGNDGGRVRLRNRAGAIVLEVEYDDMPPWPVAPDGTGHSLVLANPDLGVSDPAAWRAGARFGGTPCAPEDWPVDALSRVVINEFLAHTDLPQTDFVELYNRGGSPVDISGCVLTDEADEPKYAIPAGTILPAGGFRVFDQATLGFSLSMHGDAVFLVDTNGARVLDAVRFGAQANGVSTGHVPDGGTDWRVLAAPTPGARNGALRTPEIVINEIMFHPITAEDDDEYIELFNRGTQTVDIGYWRIEDGVSFTFPAGTELAPGAYLVVARNAQRLIAKYPWLNAANTVGDYGGSLSDRGERVVLTRPDDPDLPFEDFDIVDCVTYADGWGRWSDGGGSSLELIDAHADNRLGANWADSDESAKSEWTTIDYEDFVSDGDTAEFAVLFVLAMQAGEFLIDDISMTPVDGGANLVPNGGFSTGMAFWSARGNHLESGWDEHGGAADDGGVLHVRAIGQGNVRSMATARLPQYDRVETPLSVTPTVNRKYRLQGRVRWLAGWPYMRLSVGWYWLEAMCRMNVPETLGTPGQANSRAVENAPPVVYGLTHDPVLPAASEAVVVTCGLSDPDGIGEAVLEYRDTSAGAVYAQVALTDDGKGADALAGDGVWSARIPGMASGKIAGFRVRVSDAAPTPAAARRPYADTSRDCLVRFGDPRPSGKLGHHALWVSPENEALWLSWDTKANGMVDTTWVFNGVRALYNSRVRWRGNGRDFSKIGSASYSVELASTGRFLDDREVKMDIPCRGKSNPTYLEEHHAYWLGREAGGAASQVRFIHVHVNGSNLLRHDLEVASRDFCGYWYDDPDPHAFEHKAEDPFARHVKTATGDWNLAMYRHGLQKKFTARPDDDYQRFMLIADALQLTDEPVAVARLMALIDPFGMALYFAVNRVSGNKDTYGWTNMHNGFIYGSPWQRLRMHLVDMDGAFGIWEGLFPNGLPGELFEKPCFRRGYLRFIKALADRALDPARCNATLQAWHDALAAEGFTGKATTDMETWDANRRTNIRTELATHAVALAITTAGGQDFSTGERVVTLAGTAPIEVEAFRLNGRPLTVTFTDVTEWEARVGVAPGSHEVIVEGFDGDGNAVGSDALTITGTAAAFAPCGLVVISEIMYAPPRDKAEFVEIFNRSATESIDLGGWRLDGVDFVFDAGSIIGPGEYRVVAEDRQIYAHAYTNSEVVLGVFDGSLDNGGETLRLLMPGAGTNWVVADEVRYEDDPPWPASADGGGASLQLLDAERDNNRTCNWRASGESERPWEYFCTTGMLSGAASYAALHFYLDGAGSVLIDDVCLVQGTVAEVGENLLVNGAFESPFAVGWTATGGHADSAVTLAPVHNGSWSLRLVATREGNALRFPESVSQPCTGMAAGVPYTLSFWYLPTDREHHGLVSLIKSSTVCDTNDTYFASPYPAGCTPGAPNSLARALPSVPRLWINELMPVNLSVAADNVGEFEPWIEMLNTDTQALALGETFYLSDDSAEPRQWAFPAGATCAPGERVLVWADGEPHETTAGAPHTSFRLSATGGTVVLGCASEAGFLVLDSIVYGAVGADYAYGSFPEGSPFDRLVLQTPTPGAANRATSQVTPVRINEWMADNDSCLFDPADGDCEDWFELVNLGDHVVDLGGYSLSDDADDPAQYVIPGGTAIAPHGFLLVWADGETGQDGGDGALHVGFQLARSGEFVGLYAPDGSLVDGVAFGEQATDSSQGRWPDGAGRVYVMHPPTPSSGNRVLLMSGLVHGAAERPELSWPAIPGIVYRIESRDALQTGGWTPLGVVTASGVTVSFRDPFAFGASHRFYRLVMP